MAIKRTRKIDTYTDDGQRWPLYDYVITERREVSTGRRPSKIVGAEGQRPYVALVPAQAQDFLAPRHVPQPDHAIAGGCGQTRAVGMEGDGRPVRRPRLGT